MRPTQARGHLTELIAKSSVPLDPLQTFRRARLPMGVLRELRRVLDLTEKVLLLGGSDCPKP